MNDAWSMFYGILIPITVNVTKYLFIMINDNDDSSTPNCYSKCSQKSDLENYWNTTLTHKNVYGKCQFSIYKPN